VRGDARCGKEVLRDAMHTAVNLHKWAEERYGDDLMSAESRIAVGLPPLVGTGALVDVSVEQEADGQEEQAEGQEDPPWDTPSGDLASQLPDYVPRSPISRGPMMSMMSARALESFLSLDRYMYVQNAKSKDAPIAYAYAAPFLARCSLDTAALSSDTVMRGISPRGFFSSRSFLGRSFSGLSRSLSRSLSSQSSLLNLSDSIRFGGSFLYPLRSPTASLGGASPPGGAYSEYACWDEEDEDEVMTAPTTMPIRGDEVVMTPSAQEYDQEYDPTSPDQPPNPLHGGGEYDPRSPRYEEEPIINLSKINLSEILTGILSKVRR